MLFVYLLYEESAEIVRGASVGVLFDFGRGEAFAATTRLFSFGGGVPLPELELPPPPLQLPPPLVAGRVTVTVVELAEPGRNVEAVEGRSLMVLLVFWSFGTGAGQVEVL